MPRLASSTHSSISEGGKSKARITSYNVCYTKLLRTPTWEVDVVDDNDLLGTPVWRKGAAVDTQRATEYRLLSHARFGDQVLLQLNYVIWFKARPGEDIYAGRFDGLIWRVTLGPDGEPWLYDSIHGSYNFV